MRVVEFHVSGSDTSAVDLLVFLRESQINLLPVVEKAVSSTLF
jgi:hypothetical protein